MLRKLLIIFSIAATGLVAADTHKITLYQDSLAGAEQLAAGNYKLQLDGEKVILSQGKKSVEVPVKVEAVENTNPSTTIRFANSDGKYRIQEIRLGGTKTKLVFNL